MSVPKPAIEAALDQYSLMLNGESASEWTEEDRDGMREELHELFELGAPWIEAKALFDYADLIDDGRFGDKYYEAMTIRGRAYDILEGK